MTSESVQPLSPEDREWMDAPLGPPRPTWATQLGVLYDDAFVYARATAREHGYALARHGSEVRDFDLIAAPWREDASPAETLAEAIRNAVHGAFTQSTEDATTAGCATQRPHGRQTWAINLKHSSALGDALAASSANFHPYLDLSVMPLSPQEPK